jgi:hypothetical protein
MYSTNIIFRLSLFCGILICSIGIYLKVTNQISQGYYQYRRSGIDYKTETINGNGIIILGFLILLFSFYQFRMYKIQKEDNENIRKKEDLKILRKKNREIEKQKSKFIKN